MKRYTLMDQGDSTLTEATDGDFVRFEDAQAKIAKHALIANEKTSALTALQAEFEHVRNERVQLETVAAARADEIHKLNNELTSVTLERDMWKRQAEGK